MNKEILAACGLALYGTQWKSALAADLGVNLRSLRRWVDGDVVPPDRLRRELFKLLSDRVDEIETVKHELLNAELG